MSEEKALKVGDRIYCISTFDKTVKSIHVVNRVTKTQAFLDNNQKFKRFYGSGLESIPYESGLKHYSYKIETEELKQRLEIQNIKKEIEGKLQTVNLLLGKLEHKEIFLLQDINSKLSGILNNINCIPKE